MSKYALNNKKKLFCAVMNSKQALNIEWKVGIGSNILRSSIDGKCIRFIKNMYNEFCLLSYTVLSRDNPFHLLNFKLLRRNKTEKRKITYHSFAENVVPILFKHSNVTHSSFVCSKNICKQLSFYCDHSSICFNFISRKCVVLHWTDCINKKKRGSDFDRCK